MKAEVVCVLRLGWKRAFWAEEQHFKATKQESGSEQPDIHGRALHGTEVSSPKLMSLNLNFKEKSPREFKHKRMGLICWRAQTVRPSHCSHPHEKQGALPDGRSKTNPAAKWLLRTQAWQRFRMSGGHRGGYIKSYQHISGFSA